MKAIISRNPFSGQIARQLPFTTHQQILQKLELAKQGYQLNSRRQTQDKHVLIREVSQLVARNKTQLAKLITFQTGKPIIQAEHQVSEAVKICNYYAKHREAMLTQNIRTSAKKKTLIKHLPLGTVYCMLPDRYPLLMSFYKCLPQLLMGNGVLVRHAHTNLGVSREVEKIMRRAGFESGDYQTIWNDHKHTEMIISNPQITGVSFTGSTAKASVVAALAGKYLKRSQIAGSMRSLMLVLEDGNVQSAVEDIIKGGHFHTGQGIAPRVLIVHHSQVQKFKELLKSALENLKIGDPWHKQTQMGPLNYYQKQQQVLSNYLSYAPGNNIVYQRQQIKEPFYPPTILQSDLQSVSTLPDGPIFSIIAATNAQNCIELANKLSHSSISFIYSSKNWEALSSFLQTGAIISNKITYFDASIPLGQFGCTHSRQGHNQGIRSLSNLKTIYVN